MKMRVDGLRSSASESRLPQHLFGLAPLIVTVSLFALTCSVFQPMWANNDDAVMASILHDGLPGGMYVVFPNVCLSAPLAALYHIAPSIPWWALFQIVTIGVCDFALCKRALEGLRSRMAFKWVVFAMCQIICMGLLVHNLQFTTTSGIACGTGLFLMCRITGSRRERVAGSVLVLLGLLMRLEMSVVVAGALGCLLIVRIIGRWLENRRSDERPSLLLVATSGEIPAIASHALLIALVFAICSVIHVVAYSPEDIRSYTSFNDARSNYTDYPHATYSEYPAVFDELGWDSNLEVLANCFYCMDENVTTESFNRIVSLRDSRVYAIPSRADIWVVLCIMPLAFALSLFCATRTSSRVAIMTLGAMYYALTIGLMVVGRLPTRVAVGISLTFLGLLGSFMEELGQSDKTSSPRAERIVVVLSWAFMAALVVGSAAYGWHTWSPAARAQKAQGAQIVRDVHKDASQHPDEVFVEDLAVVTNARYSALTTNGNDARNVIFWGGWEYGSPRFEKKLEELGLSHDRPLALLRDNCYFYTLGSMDDLSKQCLLSYLQNKCGGSVEATQIRSYPSGLTVYKLHQSNNS